MSAKSFACRAPTRLSAHNSEYVCIDVISYLYAAFERMLKNIFCRRPRRLWPRRRHARRIRAAVRHTHTQKSHTRKRNPTALSFLAVVAAALDVIIAPPTPPHHQRRITARSEHIFKHIDVAAPKRISGTWNAQRNASLASRVIYGKSIRNV